MNIENPIISKTQVEIDKEAARDYMLEQVFDSAMNNLKKGEPAQVGDKTVNPVEVIWYHVMLEDKCKDAIMKLVKGDATGADDIKQVYIDMCAKVVNEEIEQEFGE